MTCRDTDRSYTYRGTSFVFNGVTYYPTMLPKETVSFAALMDLTPAVTARAKEPSTEMTLHYCETDTSHGMVWIGAL